MIGLALQIVNLAELRRAHDRVLAQTSTALAESQIEAGEFAVDHVKRFPGFKPRTGNLQRKTGYRTVRLSGGRILKVFNDANYAAAIDKGSRAHEIRASRKPFLHFKGSRGWVRAKVVRHPGTRAYKFLQRAMQAAAPRFERRMFDKMNAIAKRF